MRSRSEKGRLTKKIQDRSIRGTWNLIIDPDIGEIFIRYSQDLMVDRREIDHLGSILQMHLHQLAREQDDE